MLKQQLMLIAVLIGCFVLVTGCEQAQKVLEPALPDTQEKQLSDPVLPEEPKTEALTLKSDEFDSLPNLQSFWQVYNGDESPYALTDGHLVVQGAFNQNLWSHSTATRFYQVTDEDQFTVETSLVFDHEDVSSIAGLVIYSPTTRDARGRNGEWVLLKIWGHGAADENGNIGNIYEGAPNPYSGNPHTALLQYQHRDREIIAEVPSYNPPQGDIPIEMRLSRNGDEYEAWYKPNAESAWISLGKTTVALQGLLEVGLYLGISQPEAPGNLTVSFDYFRVTSSP